MRPLLCILAVAAPKVNCLPECTTFAHLCICVSSQQTNSVICMQMFSLCWIPTRHPSPQTCTMLARLNAGVTRRAAKPTPVHTPVGWCQDRRCLSLRSCLQGNAECWKVAQAQVVVAQLQLNQEASDWSPNAQKRLRVGRVSGQMCVREGWRSVGCSCRVGWCRSYVRLELSVSKMFKSLYFLWSWWCLGSLFFLL